MSEIQDRINRATEAINSLPLYVRMNLKFMGGPQERDMSNEQELQDEILRLNRDIEYYKGRAEELKTLFTETAMGLKRSEQACKDLMSLHSERLSEIREKLEERERLVETLGDALVYLFEDGKPDCPMAYQCFSDKPYGLLAYSDDLQNAMGGKPWQECHCVNEAQRHAEEALEELRQWKESVE